MEKEYVSPSSGLQETKKRNEVPYVTSWWSKQINELSEVKHQREKEKCDEWRERSKNTGERVRTKSSNNYASYLFGKGLTNWAFLAPPIWIKIPAYADLDFPFNRLSVGVPRGRGNRSTNRCLKNWLKVTRAGVDPGWAASWEAREWNSFRGFPLILLLLQKHNTA